MGCLSSTEESQLVNDASTNVDNGPLELNKICELPLYPQTPPIINPNNDELIFLYSSKRGIRYLTLDIKNRKIKKKKTEIKCDDDDSFDIFNSVYTLNPTENKIHFIVNNKSIKTLDLNSNTITSTNLSITTSNNNHAVIKYIKSKNRIYIFGAENKENSNDNYEFIPYSSAKKYVTSTQTKDLIKNFGSFSRCLNIEEIKNTPYIYIIGGQNTSNDNQAPNSAIWRYDILQNEWVKPGLHMDVALSSFGAINYQNKYLITFGGETYTHRTNEFVKLKSIQVLVLCEKEKNGLETGRWYECGQLNKAKLFQAVYIGNDDDTIHLFSYKGVYYTMSINTILNRLKSKDEQTLVTLKLATEAGKTVTPTKSKAIQNMGPKFDSSDEDEEEEQKDDQK